jgi:hypothetical protein
MGEHGEAHQKFKGRAPNFPASRRKSAGKPRHPGLFFDNIRILVARDREASTVDTVLPNVDCASIVVLSRAPPTASFATSGRPSCLRAQGKHPSPYRACPGKPRPDEPDPASTT